MLYIAHYCTIYSSLCYVEAAPALVFAAAGQCKHWTQSLVFQTPRQRLRDDLNGIPLLINLIDTTLFGQRQLSPHHTQPHCGTPNKASQSPVQSSEIGGTTSRDPDVNEKVSEDSCELEAKMGNHDAERPSNEPTNGN